MAQIIGHTRQIEYLSRVIAAGRFAHAYLFYGPEHVGKYTIAKAFTKTLYCTQGQGTLPGVCGTCAACRAIEQDKHPSVIILTPEHTLVSKKETRSNIPLEDIHELKRRFAFAPIGHAPRVTIIDRADTLSEEAGHAFLKLLEEPGSEIIFILIAPSRDLLLPTIVSRTTALGFSLVPETALADALASRPMAHKAELLRIANGRPGVLLSLSADAKQWQDEQSFLKRAIALFRNPDDPLHAPTLDAIAENRRDTLRLMAYFVRMLRAELIASPGMAETDTLAKTIRVANRIAGLIESTNVHPRLALDSVLIELRRRHRTQTRHATAL